VAVGSALDVVEEGIEGLGVVDAGVEASTIRAPVAVGTSDIVLVTSSRFLRLGTTAFAAPPNVISAFSARQLRLAELKRARISFASSGMEKFPLASSSNLGTESPSVTFVIPPSSVVVVQPVDPATLHVEPVKPLMQRQAQFPEFKKAEPPFWHEVAGSAAHIWSGVRSGVEVFLRITKK
jgi:hypothetical protein